MVEGLVTEIMDASFSAPCFRVRVRGLGMKEYVKKKKIASTPVKA